MAAGVYRITNSATGDFYIGSSGNVEHRLSRHRAALRRGDHQNQRLQQAWNAFGDQAFTFALIEPAEIGDLFEIEQSYLDAELPAYNHSRIAQSGPRGRVHSAETRARISAKVRGKPHSAEHNRKLAEHLRTLPRGGPVVAERARQLAIKNIGTKRSPEFCAGVSERNRGRVLSAETKAKISASRMGKGHPQTAETRAKIAAAHLGVPKKRKKPQEI